MIELDPMLLPGATTGCREMAISPDGLRLACVTYSSELLVWDLARRVVLARHTDFRHADAIEWVSDGSLLIGRHDGVDEIDALSGDVVTSCELEAAGGVHAIRRCADDSVVVATAHRIVVLRDLEPRLQLGPWPTGNGWNDRPRSVDMHPDGDAFAIVFSDDARVLDRDGGELASFDDVRAIRFGAAGEALITASYHEAKRYDWPRLSSPRSLPYVFEDARWTPAGWLAWNDQSAALLDADGEQVWATRYYDGIDAVATHGKRFYTSSRMQWIGVRNVEAGELLTILPAGAGQRIDGLCFDPTGELVVAADGAGRVTVWEFDGARALQTIDTSSFQPADAALEVATLRGAQPIVSDDGRLILVAGKQYTWPDVRADHLGRTAPSVTDEYVRVVAADGRFAVVDDHERDAAFVVDLQTAERVAMLPPHDRYDEQVVIDPGADRVLFVDVGGEGTTLRLWHPEHGRYEHELHVDVPTEHVAFEPGGAIVGWLSTEMIVDWDALDEDEEPPAVFFRWEPESGNVTRWFDGPPKLAYSTDVRFGDGIALFVGGSPTLLDLASLERTELTDGQTQSGALHASKRRVALALENGVIQLTDLDTMTSALVCTTSDGSTWSRRDGDFDLTLSEVAT